MKMSDRGVALILALILLALILALGTALITMATIDVRVGDNYRTHTQAFYLADSGITEALEVIRKSTKLPSELLNAASGGFEISTARDWDSLTGSGNVPLLPLDASPGSSRRGTYGVWLRNDPSDGTRNLVDSNRVLSLLSIGKAGNSEVTLEATVKKMEVPTIPAAILADGPLAVWSAPASLTVDGRDASGVSDRIALGFMRDSDRALASFASSANVDDMLGLPLRTSRGLERLAGRLAEDATDVYDPPFPSAVAIRDVGTASDYRIVVVNGDCDLGAAGFVTGHGILLCRGNLTVRGDFSWNGIILVLGQGSLRWVAGSGEVRGAVLLARTRGAMRSPSNPLGDPLSQRGPIELDFSPARGSIQADSAQILRANQPLRWSPIAIEER